MTKTTDEINRDADDIEIIEPSVALPVPTDDHTPHQLLAVAVHRGSDVVVIEGLMTLAERWDANEARKAFNADFALVDIPSIPKTARVNFESNKGTTDYPYETLDDVTTTVNPIIIPLGFKYRWRTTQDEKTGRITVTCKLSHKDGHIEENSLSGMPDQTGNKNPIQAVVSSTTYLQRATRYAQISCR